MFSHALPCIKTDGIDMHPHDHEHSSMMQTGLAIGDSSLVFQELNKANHTCKHALLSYCSKTRLQADPET